MPVKAGDTCQIGNVCQSDFVAVIPAKAGIQVVLLFNMLKLFK